MSKFVDMVRKTLDHGKEALDEFLDKLPDDDKLQETAARIMDKVAKNIKALDKKSAVELEKLADQLRGGSGSSCWQELQEGASKIKDDIKSAPVSKRFKEFLSAVGELAKSIIGGKDVDKAWKGVTDSVKNLSKAISTSVNPTMSR